MKNRPILILIGVLCFSAFLPLLSINSVNGVSPRLIRIMSSVTGLNSTTLGNSTGPLPPGGITFILNVSLSGSTSDLATWQVAITFDNNSLRCTNLTIPESDPSYVFHGLQEIKNTDFSDAAQNGTYTGGKPEIIAGGSLLDVTQAVSTNNSLLCTMNFTLFKAGQGNETTISFWPYSAGETFLWDSNGVDIPFGTEGFSVNILEGAQVRFDATGLDSSATATVVTVNGSSVSANQMPYSTWIEKGSTLTYFYSNVTSLIAGKQFALNGVIGPNSPITVTSSVNVTGNYKTQYYLTVASTSDSPNPTSAWFDNGTSITASVTSPSSGPQGTRYICTGWSGTGSVPSSGGSLSAVFTLNQPSSITWNWKTQYLLTAFTSPSFLSPQPSMVPIGENASANSWWYDSGANVALTAETVENYTFSIWKVDDVPQGQGVNPLQVVMNTSHVVAAYYTSSSAVPDIGILDLVVSKTLVGEGFAVAINVTAVNEGANTESFNLTIYANETAFANQVVTLESGDLGTRTITITWNTTGLAAGNYTIWAYADPLPSETDTADNNCTCPVPIHVGVPGDVSSATSGVYDGVTNMRDIAYLVSLFNTKPTSSNWNPNADVNGDGVCNMKDIAIAVLNFNQHE